MLISPTCNNALLQSNSGKIHVNRINICSSELMYECAGPLTFYLTIQNALLIAYFERFT